MGLEGLIQNTKEFGREAVISGMIIASGFLGYGCGSLATMKGTNYDYPEWFYSPGEEERNTVSSSSLIATIGAVMGVTTNSMRDAVIGTALETYGTLESQREIAREGKTEVNVYPNTPIAAAVADATRVPEYDLPLLDRFYADGHLLQKRFFGEKLGFLENRIELHHIDIAEIDGLQYLFTYDRALDLNGDGAISFDELLGVKRNFGRGEPIKVGVGFRGSAMKVKKSVSPSERKSTNSEISLKLFDEERNLIGEKNHEYTFDDFNQERMIWWSLDNSKLDSGFYTLEASYSDDFDVELDKREWVGGSGKDIKREEVLFKKITTLRQFFQVLE